MVSHYLRLTLFNPTLWNFLGGISVKTEIVGLYNFDRNQTK